MKKVAILQSNYIPWKGYFDLIAAVDEFIIYDEVQFTKNDWRNRNKIKTSRGLEWLSIPVGKKIDRRIKDVHIDDRYWQQKHWKSIINSYSKAKYFKEISTFLEPLYLGINHTNLSELNKIFIAEISKYLNINTNLTDSTNYYLCEGKTERLVSICQQANANVYISGPSGKNYIDINLFEKNNIIVEWFDYSNYPEYPQLWDGYFHEVSIIDLLFNCGGHSHQFLKSKN